MHSLFKLACTSLLLAVAPAMAAPAAPDPITDFIVAVENLDQSIARTSADLLRCGDLTPLLMGYAEDRKLLCAGLRALGQTAATLKATVATIPRPWASTDVEAVGDEMAALPARTEEVEKAVRKIRASNRPEEIKHLLVKGNFRDNWPPVRAALAAVRQIYDNHIAAPVQVPTPPEQAPGAPPPAAHRKAQR